MSYYADCLPHRTGCRNCGKTPEGRKRYYCSDECRTEFERNHFWDTARTSALVRARLSGRWGHECARCHREINGIPEVNHIQPLNGQRHFFGCGHHQENLEVVCHECHLAITAEQRREGLIGKPKAQQQLALGLIA